MADIDLQLIASHAAAADTRQTAVRSPVAAPGRDDQRDAPRSSQGLSASANAPALDLSRPVAFDALLAAQQARTTDNVRTFDARRAYGEASPQSSDAPAPEAPPFEAQGTPPQFASPIDAATDDNVVYLPTASLGASDTPSDPPPVQDRTTSFASQAYLNAGAFDGRAFAASAADGGFTAQPQGIDIVV